MSARTESSSRERERGKRKRNNGKTPDVQYLDYKNKFRAIMIHTRCTLDGTLERRDCKECMFSPFSRSSERIRPRRGWSRRKCCGLSRDVWRPWNGNSASIKKPCTRRRRSLFVNWSGRSTVSRTSWSTTTSSVGWVSFHIPTRVVHVLSTYRSTSSIVESSFGYSSRLFIRRATKLDLNCYECLSLNSNGRAYTFLERFIESE